MFVTCDDVAEEGGVGGEVGGGLGGPLGGERGHGGVGLEVHADGRELDEVAPDVHPSHPGAGEEVSVGGARGPLERREDDAVDLKLRHGHV